jgi:hypothetical protein
MQWNDGSMNILSNRVITLIPEQPDGTQQQKTIFMAQGILPPVMFLLYILLLKPF